MIGVCCRAHFAFLLLAALLSIKSRSVTALAGREIYGIPRSGWKSSSWKWGYAVGTGHDCAAICRRKYSKRSDRVALVNDLLQSKGPDNFEEIKLVLALAWQKGRWDGSDGGPGGYGDVLTYMAEARRYEDGSEEQCSQLLIHDMASRFHLLAPTSDDSNAMELLVLVEPQDLDTDARRRQCSGLVLKAMGFVENGL